MSSSTSSFDAAFKGQEGNWGRFIKVALGMTAAVVGLFLAAAIALDPYDTGRFGVWQSVTGVRQQGPRTANASRGRDPQFESAVIGNSQMQLISPDRLTEATGERFVQLSIPGTYPLEHLAVLEWFLSQRRPRLSTVVLGVDTTWCRTDPELKPINPFPFWLYSSSTWEYLRGLIRTGTVEELGRRIEFFFNPRMRLAARNGYWDYEPEYLRLGLGDTPRTREKLDNPETVYLATQDKVFPAAPKLRALMEAMPASLRLVMIHNPAYISAQPRPGTPQHETMEACKATYAALAASRPNTVFIDWMRDTPLHRDRLLWFDVVHYRHPVAQAIDADVAAAIRRMR